MAVIDRSNKVLPIIDGCNRNEPINKIYKQDLIYVKSCESITVVNRETGVIIGVFYNTEFVGSLLAENQTVWGFGDKNNKILAVVRKIGKLLYLEIEKEDAQITEVCNKNQDISYETGYNSEESLTLKQQTTLFSKNQDIRSKDKSRKSLEINKRDRPESGVGSIISRYSCVENNYSIVDLDNESNYSNITESNINYLKLTPIFDDNGFVLGFNTTNNKNKVRR